MCPPVPPAASTICDAVAASSLDAPREGAARQRQQHADAEAMATIDEPP
jgi:hypothetical protein